MLIGVLLFAQFAVSTYACPGLKAADSMANGGAVDITVDISLAAAAGVIAAQPAPMSPRCDQMDPDAINLCAAHCQQGQQATDTAPASVVGAAVLAVLYFLPFEPQLALGSGRSSPTQDAQWAAAPEPPHAILHCVFRI